MRRMQQGFVPCKDDKPKNAEISPFQAGSDYFVSANIFSINIPYPLVGSFTSTCVTAPISLPFWIMGEPLTSVVNRGQQISFKIDIFKLYIFYSAGRTCLSSPIS